MEMKAEYGQPDGGVVNIDKEKGGLHERVMVERFSSKLLGGPADSGGRPQYRRIEGGVRANAGPSGAHRRDEGCRIST